MYVVITKCSHDKNCWYYDKVGTIHKVDDSIFPDVYLIWDDKGGPYPYISHEDAEEITPNLMEKFMIWYKTIKK